MKITKYLRWVLYFTMGIILFQGCNKLTPYFSDAAVYSFIESEQVVEVDAETKSFRIVVKRVKILQGEGGAPRVRIDTSNTTARHNEHFINYVDTLRWNSIGDFTPTDSSNTFYRDVELLPKKITNEVTIYYDMDGHFDYGNIANLIRHKVILKPKANN